MLLIASATALVICLSLRSGECGTRRIISRDIYSSQQKDDSNSNKQQSGIRDHFPGPGRFVVNPLESMLARAQDFSPIKIESNDKGIVRVQFRRVLPKVAAYMGDAYQRFQSSLSDLLSKTIYG